MSEVQISKTLLILRANASSTQSAETFLRNREWSVFATTSLKDFLTYIIQKKPSFVMLSVDHPNKKVAVMPKILTQSFPICVFVFAENSSSMSFRKLQDVNCAYKINPPATGPAIERTVNKFLKDQEKKLKDQADKPAGESTHRSDGSLDSKLNIIQSGAGAGDNSQTQTEGGGWNNQAASIFSQLLDGDDNAKNDKSAIDSDGSSSGGAGVIVAKGDKKEGNGSWIPSDTPEGTVGNVGGAPGSLATSGGSIDPHNPDNAGVAGILSGNGSSNEMNSTQAGSLGVHSGSAGHAGPNGQNGFLGNTGNTNNAHGNDGNATDGTAGSLSSGGASGKGAGRRKDGADGSPGSADFDQDSGSGEGQAGTLQSGGGQGPSGKDKKGKAGTGLPGAMSYNEDDFEESDQTRKLGHDPKTIQVGKEKGKKESAPAGEGEDVAAGKLITPKKYDKDQKTITVLGKNARESMDSIILKGTKAALDETVEVLDGEVSQELEDSSHVACIVVESARFNGYLIAALGKNRKMDGKFIKAIQEKLFKFLNDNGENITDKDNMNLKIKKVEFEDWAVEYADFLKKSVHNGEEIAMAFFPVTSVRPEVGESAAATMASVKLSEMEGDKTVEFNMYIYLPSNKKYILYTPKGGKFYGDQKNRLAEKGVKEVHMLKSEVNDLSKYKAQNYLNNLIDGYKKKKAESSAA